MNDEDLRTIVFAALKGLPEQEWACYTYSSGNYEITKLRGTTVQILRAVERAARAAERDAIGDILSDMLSRDEHDQPLDCAWNHALDALGDALRARAEGGA